MIENNLPNVAFQVDVSSPDILQRQIDIPMNPFADLDSSIRYLLDQEFDPVRVRYEAPLNTASIFNYDTLRQIGEDFKKCELKILVTNQHRSRLITGIQESVNHASLFPVHETYKTLDLIPRDATTLKVPDGYPIVDDEGNFTGELWRLDIHNHPDGAKFPSDPYPSAADLSYAPFSSMLSIILSTEGITFYGQAVGLSEAAPNTIKDYFKRMKYQSIRAALQDRGFNLEFFKCLRSENLSTLGEYKKRICEYIQVPLRVVPWTEKETINLLLEKLRLNPTLDIKDFLN